MNRNQKFKIEKKLIALPFIKWDRFIEFDDVKDIIVFGWIDRQDSYKDFVYIEFSEHQEVVIWGTSSSLHSQAIGEVLQPDSKHNDCKRVEHRFNIKNCIRL